MKYILSSATLFLLITICISCDCDTDQSTVTLVPVDRGTTEILLSARNEADNVVIPIMITLPKNKQGPFKAVVVMHGSGGPWDDNPPDCNIGTLSDQNTEWRDLLLNENIAAAFPDSYSMRGTCENEGAYKNPPLKFLISGTFIRNRDAYATLKLLRSLVWADTKEPIIEPENIAIVGFSDGGTAVLSTLYDTNFTPTSWQWKQSFSGVTYTKEILPPVEKPAQGGFKTGVLYYPGSYHNGYYGDLCDAGEGIYRSYCDLQFHLPLEDPLTENAQCLINTILQNGGGASTVYEYAGIGHGFDGDVEPESTQARTRTINYLKQKLGL